MSTITPYVAALVFGLLAQPAFSENGEGVIARCGASQGITYFFHDATVNPKPSGWAQDAIKGGKIVLIRLGKEWDIQFDDSVGAYGYRQDGARVIPLGYSESRLTIGAFHGTYTDVYTFDFVNREVVWTSHKIGTVIPKVGIYHASCSFMTAP